MNRILVAVAVLAVALAATVGLQRFNAEPTSGYPAAEFTLPDLNRRPVSLSQFRGKLVFLNLWTTWCPPCRMEMSAMESLHRRFKDQGLVVLAVNQDDERTVSEVPGFVRERQLTFPVLLDPAGTLSTRYGVTGYPETFLIDPEGKVIRHYIGPDEWDGKEAIAYFADLLARTVAPNAAAAGAAGH